jgi:threonine/homoserine/homoserine lactone efflux protein
MEFSELFLAWFVGVVSGLLVSIPVGPINITILNEGAVRGFRWAMLVGLGSVTMEVIYCTIGFAGFAGLFTSTFVRATMELATFCLMFILGLKYTFMRSMPATNKTVEQVEHRLHPHTAFMTGFVRVLGNPNVLLCWIALSATFTTHHWIDSTWLSKLVCISGVTTGALGWFVLLSYLVSLGKGKFSEKTLVRMSQLSGVTLLLMAAIIGVRIVLLLARREHLIPL